jgi:Ribosomal protein L11 methyltransferase (PrmA)
MHMTTWDTCYADAERGVAFFDGVLIEADPITDPRWDRVLPLFEEEQILMCRQMEHLLGGDLLALDVGTGSGVFAIWAARKGCSVVAIDINPRALRMAKDNARKNGIPICEELAALRPGSIYFDKREFSHSFLRTGLPQEYDLIFLSPPYNPTCPGVFPAQHAFAGEDGQRSFNEQIEVVPKVLKKGGCCIGNQMTYKTGDDVEALKTISAVFSKGCHTNWGCVIEPFDTKSFLQEQYSCFLEATCEGSPRPPDVEAFIDRISVTRPQMILIYYEVRPTDTQAALDQIAPGNMFNVPGKDWRSRAWLHRQVVENTSTANYFPSPALFMRSGPAAVLPELPPEEQDADKLEHRRYRDSILRAIDDWVQRNRLLCSDVPNQPRFSLIFVDTAPWFDTPEGWVSNREECKVWLSPPWDGELAERLLRSWQDNTAIQQRSKVAPFLHKHFVGKNYPRLWSDIMFPSLEKDVRRELLQPEDEALWDLLQRTLAKEKDFTANHAEISYERDNGYATSRLSSLSVSDRLSLWEAVDEQIKAATNQRPSQEMRRDHLRLCHLSMLERTHHRFEREFSDCGRRTRVRWSTLAGLPLSLAFSTDGDKKDSLASYRGGVWIYASSTEAWTKAHERRLIDFMRLTWLLYEGYYNVQATAHTVRYEKQAAVASYAKGAAHGFKNALLLPPLFLDRSNLKVLNTLRHAATVTDKMLEDAAATEIDMEIAGVLLEHLQQQAQLFFWVMSPDRFQQERNDPRQKMRWPDLPAGIVACIGAFFGAAIVFSTTGASHFSDKDTDDNNSPIDRKPQAVGASIPDESWRSIARSAASNGSRLTKYRMSDNDDGLGVLITSALTTDFIDGLLGETFRDIVEFEFSIAARPDVINTLPIGGVSRGVLEAVLVELVQNAVRSSLKCERQSRPYVRIEVENTGSGAMINVRNLAKRESAERLWQYKQGDYNPSGGIRGLRQLGALERMLKSDLPISLEWPHKGASILTNDHVEVVWCVKLGRY